VSELTARLKKSEQLNCELRSAEAELKRTNAEASMNIAELESDIEYFKRTFTHRQIYEVVSLICLTVHKLFSSIMMIVSERYRCCRRH